jgi:Ni/Co efflux regulator RcnB
MERELAHKLWVVTRKGENAELPSRVGRIARKVQSLNGDAEQVNRIVELNLGMREKEHNSKGNVIKHTSLARTLGRLASGLQHPTYRVKDHKHHRAVRTSNCERAHTREVDALRQYSHRSAPFRVGGHMWAKVGAKGKRRFRALLHTSDAIARNGDITVALESLRAL